MPLMRFQLRNEYGLGDPELFRGPAKREDPNALLQGVAVSGLVGIIRQLGDLAEFAADVFQDLHEQITTTASRGRAMMARMRRIEDDLSAVEKAVHDQTSHIHFAYTVGSSWHSTVRIDCEHLRRSDLPYFMMDSYEGCREPPKFSSLDQFDSSGAGSGSCQRRYSDPTFFKIASSSMQSGKNRKNKKSQKKSENKRKPSRSKDEGVEYTASFSRCFSGEQYVSPASAGPSIDAEPAEEITLAKGNEEEEEEEEEEDDDSSLSCSSAPRDTYVEERRELPDVEDNFYDKYLEAQEAMGPGDAAWEVSPEITMPKPKSRALISSPVLEVSYPLASENQACSTSGESPMKVIISAPVDDINEAQSSQTPVLMENVAECSSKQSVKHGEATSETDNYVDAPNTLQSETETEIEPQISTNIQSADTKIETIAAEPVKFWTNGGLLGLQPSKPPEISSQVNVQLDDVGPSLEEEGSTWHEESSPPLDLMKLSSCPIDGFRTSSLRLEFPSGRLREGVEDVMFPFFQLLPRSTAEPLVNGSDSDDETFGRSCPYSSSDDSRSPRSESNSEFWAQDESTYPRLLDLAIDSAINGTNGGDLPKLNSPESSSGCPPRGEEATPFQLRPTTTSTVRLSTEPAAVYQIPLTQVLLS
ncbi:SCAR-like protein 2 isoform X2 [Wolffia australiana]